MVAATFRCRSDHWLFVPRCSPAVKMWPASIPYSHNSSGCPNQKKRQARKVSQEARMTEFLVKNHFFLDDINEPRGPGRHDSEQLWPIHGAAELGDGELLRSLLRARADSTQVPWITRCIQQVSNFQSILTIWMDRSNSQETHKIKVMKAVNESRPPAPPKKNRTGSRGRVNLVQKSS